MSPRANEPTINGRRLTLVEKAALAALERHAVEHLGQWFPASAVFSGRGRAANNRRSRLVALARAGVPQQREIECWESYYGIYFALAPTRTLFDQLEEWTASQGPMNRRCPPTRLEVAG